MSANATKPTFGYTLVVMAATVIVLAGIKVAAAITVPFFLSVFITIVLSPLYLWLVKRGMTTGVALLTVVVTLFGIAATVMVLVGSSIHDFSQNLPAYRSKLHDDFAMLTAYLDAHGIHIPKEDISAFFAADSIMEYIAHTLKSFGSVMTNSMLILFTVAFMLLEVSQFSEKLASIESPRLHAFTRANDTIKRFVMLKMLTSLATGIVVAVGLTVLKVDYAILWGVLAFLLNFIPNIGSVIAAVPAVVTALVQYDPTHALLTAGLYIIVNVLIGSIWEPRIMGKGLGLSTLVVFLSLIFWGWLLGPVGMLLSVPLTIVVKILLDATEETRWIAVMLGNGTRNRLD